MFLHYTLTLLLIAAMSYGVLAYKQANSAATQISSVSISGRRRPFSLLMSNTFGIQKLGEKVVETPVIGVIPEAEVEDDFQRISHGTSGRDERFNAEAASTTTGGMLYSTADMDTLIGVDKSLRQHSLLKSLGPTSVMGPKDKAHRIHLAAAEGLLPSTFHRGAILGTDVKSGGLFTDWDFEL